MKFYDLDLTQIIPYGIPLSTENHVEYTGYINEFFIRGFENWFKTLFTLEGGELARDYSRSCSAPFSLPACNFCNDTQLQTFIEENGFKYYSNNAHNINAQFLYDLYKYPFGTEDYLTSIARYCANTLEVEASAIYSDTPYLYTITISGDISGSVNVGELSERMIEHLKILGTAHTKVDGLRFEEDDNTAEAYCGGVVDDIQTMLTLSVSEPSSDATLRTYLTNSSNYRNQSLYNTSLRGCPRSPYSRVTVNYSNYENTLVRLRSATTSGLAYPVVGYADFRKQNPASTYIVNDQDVMIQTLVSGTSVRFMYLSEEKMIEYGLSDFKKETLYNSLGVRQQVFSFRTGGFKRYVEAEDYVNNPSTFTIMKENLLGSYGTLGFFKDKHFIGYLSDDGKAVASFGGGDTEYKVGYRIGSFSYSTKFINDDAFDYVIDKIFGCDDLTHVPTLGSVADAEIYDKISDVNGDPIDYENSFTFGKDAQARLTIKCSQTIENAVWIQFHIVPKAGYLEGWTTLNANAASSNSTGTQGGYMGLYKCYSSTLQPGGVSEGDLESDYGSGFEPVCIFTCSTTALNARRFRCINEMQAFAGMINASNNFMRLDNNLQSVIESHKRKIYGPVLNSSAVYVVARFTSINSADIDIQWTNPRKNRLYSFEITPALAFGISEGYDGCKIYIIDEINHDSSLADKVTTSLEYNTTTQKYNIIFKYISDDVITEITHIKVHADFHLE